MTTVIIKIAQPMPAMPGKVQDEYKHLPLADKVKQYIDCAEGDDSGYHIDYLKEMYQTIIKLQVIPEELKPVLKLLEEFFLKHRGVMSIDGVDLEAESLFRYL